MGADLSVFGEDAPAKLKKAGLGTAVTIGTLYALIEMGIRLGVVQPAPLPTRPQDMDQESRQAFMALAQQTSEIHAGMAPIDAVTGTPLPREHMRSMREHAEAERKQNEKLDKMIAVLEQLVLLERRASR